jgi:hypothetical protein
MGAGNPLVNNPASIERDKQILNDRVKGMTYRALGEKYGMSEAGAHGIVKKHAERTIKPAAEEVVQVEIERLERLLLALSDKIDRGDVRAIETAIKLSESLRKLQGVDAAVKSEMELVINPATVELEERLRKAAQMNKEDN